MIRYTDLNHYQQVYIQRFIVENPTEVGPEEATHDSILFDCTFPHSFFVAMKESEINFLAKGGTDERMADMDLPLGFSETFQGDDGEEAQLKSLNWVHKIIDDCYSFRSKRFVLEEKTQKAQGTQYFPIKRPFMDEISMSLFQMLSKRFGMGTLVKKAGVEVLDSVKMWRTVDLDIQLFGVLLSSATYDTVDVKEFLARRATLQPYTVTKIDYIMQQFKVHRRYVKARDIPGLLRKALAPKSYSTLNSGASLEQEQALKQHNDFNKAVLDRCRAALSTFCDPAGRFPALVPHPDFYTPPFVKENPYVKHAPAVSPERKLPPKAAGTKDRLKKLEGDPSADHHTSTQADEGRFYYMDTIVEASQLEWLMLMNMKQERLHPTIRKANPLGRRSPLPGSQQPRSGSRPTSPAPTAGATKGRKRSPSITRFLDFGNTPSSDATPSRYMDPHRQSTSPQMVLAARRDSSDGFQRRNSNSPTNSRRGSTYNQYGGLVDSGASKRLPPRRKKGQPGSPTTVIVGHEGNTTGNYLVGAVDADMVDMPLDFDPTVASPQGSPHSKRRTSSSSAKRSTQSPPPAKASGNPGATAAWLKVKNSATGGLQSPPNPPGRRGAVSMDPLELEKGANPFGEVMGSPQDPAFGEVMSEDDGESGDEVTERDKENFKDMAGVSSKREVWQPGQSRAPEQPTFSNGVAFRAALSM